MSILPLDNLAFVAAALALEVAAIGAMLIPAFRTWRRKRRMARLLKESVQRYNQLPCIRALRDISTNWRE